MTSIILGLSEELAETVRRTRRDEHGNHDLTERVVREAHSAPCRVCLRDAEVGEAVLLMGYSPFAVATPYRTVGPIFVHAGRCARFAGGEVPEALRRRLLSVRAYDGAGRLLDSDVVPGEGLAALAERLLAGAAELHVHGARPGCFLCRIVAP